MSCTVCGKEIKRFGKLPKCAFCNHECYSIYKSRKWSGDNNPRFSGGELKLTCTECDKEFTSKRYGMGREQKTCSRECYSKRRSRIYRGEKHPMYRGVEGKTARPVRMQKKYERWIKAIKERDGKCVHCGSKENLHAHHIKELATLVNEYKQKHGRLETQDNFFYQMDNGITLCKLCHREVHKINRENCWKPQGGNQQPSFKED